MINKIIFLDTETTGLDESAQIITLGITDRDGKTIMDEEIRPSVEITDGASKINGYTNEAVQKHPKTFADIEEQLFELMSNNDVVIYNAPFDLRIIVQTHAATGRGYRPKISAYCLMQYYADAFNYERWQKLQNAVTQMDIKHDPNLYHNAIGDCVATSKIFRKMGASIDKMREYRHEIADTPF